MKPRRVSVAGMVCGLLAAVALTGNPDGPARAQSFARTDTSTGGSGLIVPRFVSLSVGRANMRTGPGERYPILWVYVRDGLPLEVTAEYGSWRRVRDQDGTTGWMHVRLLSGRRTAVISGGERVLRASEDDASRPLLRLQPGVVVNILRCEEAWCRIEVRGKKGWLPRDSMWGTYTDENIG